MSEDKTLAEVLAERRTQLESAADRIDAAVTEAETGVPANGSKKKKKKKPKPVPPAPPPVEEVGAGRDFAAENARRLMQQLNARYEAAKRAGNVDLMNKVDAQRKALAASAE